MRRPSWLVWKPGMAMQLTLSLEDLPPPAATTGHVNSRKGPSPRAQITVQERRPARRGSPAESES